MGASAGALYRVGTVSVTNLSVNVVGVGSQWVNDLIAVAIGDLFTLDMKTWYEVIAITDDTHITLDRGFEGITGSNLNYAIIRNTSGTVLTRIAGQITVQFNQKQLFLDELRTWLNSTNAAENVTDSHGLVSTITTPTQMALEHSTRIAQVDSLVGSVQAMTKAEFDANREINKSRFVGSGEDSNIDFATAYTLLATVANQLTINTNVKYIAGVRCVMPTSVITLPAAPNGLQNIAGGADFVDLAAAIVAGGTGLTQSVITRKDLVLAKLSLANYTANITAEIQDKDKNIFADNGILKQYSASYFTRQGLRDYTSKSDAMTAFGYTQDVVDKGLWTDGVDYFVPIDLVQRLNKGAYHPTYNSYGCAYLNATINSVVWSNSTAIDPTSVSDCFNSVNITTDNTSSGYNNNTGKIGVAALSGHPDGKFYDAIYAGQVKDIRASARRKSPQELLSDYSKKAIAGTIRGDESVPFTKVSLAGTGVHVSAASVWHWDVADNFVVYTNITWAVSDWFYLYDATKNFIVRFKGSQQLNDDRVIINNASTSSNFQIISGTLLQNTLGTGSTAYILHETLVTASFETLDWQDIIGLPANISATFPNGVYGKWVPIIPLLGTNIFNFNRKNIQNNQWLKTINNGTAWTVLATPATNATNNWTPIDVTVNDVYLLSYKTKASQLKTNTAVLKLKNNQVIATNDKAHSTFVTGLTSLVPVGAESEYLGVLSDKANLLTYQTKSIVTTAGAIASFAIGTLNSQYYLQIWPDNVGILDYDNAAKMIELPFFTGEA